MVDGCVYVTYMQFLCIAHVECLEGGEWSVTAESYEASPVTQHDVDNLATVGAPADDTSPEACAGDMSDVAIPPDSHTTPPVTESEHSHALVPYDENNLTLLQRKARYDMRKLIQRQKHNTEKQLQV